MKFKVEWTFLAEITYFNEMDFIYKKWNLKQVNIFEELVEKEISRLSINPEIGTLKNNNLFSLIISKQTALIYRIKKENKSIELILFWNNLKNPEDLSKFL